MRCVQRGIPIAVVSARWGHTSIELTVKTYGRWSAEAREQWDWIKKLDTPVDTVARTVRWQTSLSYRFSKIATR